MPLGENMPLFPGLALAYEGSWIDETLRKTNISSFALMFSDVKSCAQYVFLA